MPTDNYRLQARQAMDHFLTYDQQALIRKLNLPADDAYLYPRMLGRDYRIHRRTGDIQRRQDDGWSASVSPEEAMTLTPKKAHCASSRRAMGMAPWP